MSDSVLGVASAATVLRPPVVQRKRAAKKVAKTSLAITVTDHERLSRWALELQVPLGQVVAYLCDLAERATAARARKADTMRAVQAARRAKQAEGTDIVEAEVAVAEEEEVVNAS